MAVVSKQCMRESQALHPDYYSTTKKTANLLSNRGRRRLSHDGTNQIDGLQSAADARGKIARRSARREFSERAKMPMPQGFSHGAKTFARTGRERGRVACTMRNRARERG